MTTTRRKADGLSLWAQMAWARKSARFILVISGILLLLGLGAPRRAEAQVESVIHNFAGGTGDGTNSWARLFRDSSGNLYGTTVYGGSSTNCVYGCGTVFELVYDSTTNSYTEQVLHNFTGSDGSSPLAGLVRDSSGNLYGTTENGGSSGDGAVFELVYHSTTNSYTEQVLYNFAGGTSDGSLPLGGLVRDSSGNLYGTTNAGGPSNQGTVFELLYDSTTDSYTEQVLYSFAGSDGANPHAGLVRDSSGNLYGTASLGGSSTNCPYGCGTVFELIPNPSTPTGYSETLLHNFSGAGDGSMPQGTLVRTSSGNLYGATGSGGSSTNCTYGCGTVFELVYDSTTNSYTEQVLYSFTGSDGANPQGLVRDLSGNLYGTTNSGGSSTNCTYGCGTVFKLVYDSTSNSDTEQVLYNFAGGTSDGSLPLAGLVRDSSGNLYGTTAGGGPSSACYAAGCGTVFGIAPVALSATSLDFGGVAIDTSSSVQTVTITNIGGGNFSYSTVSLSGANAADFTITSNNCSTPVAPGGACSVSVTFAPTAANNELASLALSQSGMTQTVALTGTGAFAAASLSATGLAFSAQPVGATSSAQTVTVTNTSTFALNITAVSITGDFAIDSNTCTASVDAGQSCTVGVTFSPTTAGTRTGTLSFTNNAADSPQTVALSGNGADFSLTARTTSETVAPGAAASFDLQLSPEGGFNQPVSLACFGAPKGSTCTATPTPVTLDGSNSIAVSLKVTTSGNAGVAPADPPKFVPPCVPLPVSTWLAMFCLLGLIVLAKVRPNGRRFRLAPFATLALLVMLWAACGGGGSNPSSTTSSNATPAGTYSLTVTGTSGTLSHSTTVSLTVQ